MALKSIKGRSVGIQKKIVLALSREIRQFCCK